MSFGWRNILYGRIYVNFSFLTLHKVCTKARLLGERSLRIREVYRGREIFKLQNRLAQPGPDALYYP